MTAPRRQIFGAVLLVALLVLTALWASWGKPMPTIVKPVAAPNPIQVKQIPRVQLYAEGLLDSTTDIPNKVVVDNKPVNLTIVGAGQRQLCIDEQCIVIDFPNKRLSTIMKAPR